MAVTNFDAVAGAVNSNIGNQIKFAIANGTTNSNGNCKLQTTKKIQILSCFLDNTYSFGIVTFYPGAEKAPQEGANTWYIHVMGYEASYSVVANKQIQFGYYYIEME